MKYTVTSQMLEHAEQVTGRPIAKDELTSGEHLTWDQMFPNTAGPFSRPGHVVGHAFTSYTMLAVCLRGLMVLFGGTHDQLEYVGCSAHTPDDLEALADRNDISSVLTVRAWDVPETV